MNISDETSTTPNLSSFDNVTSNYIWNAEIQTIFSVIYLTNAILGIPTKCYVIWLIFMGNDGNGSEVVSQFFSLNISVSDLLFCLCSLTITLMSKYQTILTLICFVTALPNIGRPLFVFLTSVNHYLAVLHPITFLKYKQLRYKFIFSAVVWLMVLPSGMFFVYVLPKQKMRLFICFLLPPCSLFLTIKLFFCLAIFRALKHPGPGQKGKDRKKTNQVKRKAINAILITIVTMAIQYSFLFLAGFCYSALSLRQFYIFWSGAIAISLMSGYVHPFLYIYKVRKH